MAKYKITDEDRAVANQERAERMPFGVNEVVITGAVYAETEAGKEYLEVEVENAEGLKDKARVWFVGGAAPYSLQTIQQIVVHSAPEAEKEKARMAVQSAADGDELAAIINKKCIGSQCWLTKYYDPERTYVNANGEERRSINTNILGYKPRLKPELMPDETNTNNTVSTPFGAATEAPADAAGAVPADDAWNDDKKAE